MTAAERIGLLFIAAFFLWFSRGDDFRGAALGIAAVALIAAIII